MSKYYKSYNKKRNYKRKENKKVRSVFRVVAFILLGLAIVGLTFNLFETIFNHDKENAVNENRTIYYIPNNEWNIDVHTLKSNVAAWVWNEEGEPKSKFVLGKDSNNDGIIEFSFDNRYTGVNFVNLKSGMILSSNIKWEDVEVQTDDIALPNDENVYYHHYANEWSNSDERLFEVTTEEMSVFFYTEYMWASLSNPVMYCFDKTGVKENTFISMTQCGDAKYTATVPAGYTHIIFLEYGEDGVIGEWNDVLNQTSDLIIPSDEAINFYISTNEWTIDVE